MDARQAVSAGTPSFGMLRAVVARRDVLAGAPVFGMVQARLMGGVR